jgi:hypothetical protein
MNNQIFLTGKVIETESYNYSGDVECEGTGVWLSELLTDERFMGKRVEITVTTIDDTEG